MTEEQHDKKSGKKLTPVWRALLEVGFIVFLFYSNLLMGEYEHSGYGQQHSLLWAVEDIFTITNFVIAVVFGLVGHLVFDFFRNRL
jgi:uncharacterized protein with PQ loop repeat